MEKIFNGEKVHVLAWKQGGKPGTIKADREIILDIARESGEYKIATYTYSNATREVEERDPDWDAFFSKKEESKKYTCEIWDITTGRLLLTAEADGPYAARRAAMAKYAESLLGDAVSHNLGNSAKDGVYTLSIAQAVASGLPIQGDLL
jgi:hypothetical protein